MAGAGCSGPTNTNPTNTNTLGAQVPALQLPGASGSKVGGSSTRELPETTGTKKGDSYLGLLRWGRTLEVTVHTI